MYIYQGRVNYKFVFWYNGVNYNFVIAILHSFRNYNGNTSSKKSNALLGHECANPHSPATVTPPPPPAAPPEGNAADIHSDELRNSKKSKVEIPNNQENNRDAIMPDAEKDSQPSKYFKDAHLEASSEEVFKDECWGDLLDPELPEDK